MLLFTFTRTLSKMHLLFYIDNNLVETFPLALYPIADERERHAHLQGAIHHVLKKWEEKLVEGVDSHYIIKLRTTQ